MNLKLPSRIGVTGASGHLGSRFCQKLHDHDIPYNVIRYKKDFNAKCDLIFHLAAPPSDCTKKIADAFRDFNSAILEYKNKWKSFVIGTGTLWQFGLIDKYPVKEYADIKEWQMRNLCDVTLVLFSVYSSEVRSNRGFLPQLVDAIKTGTIISEATSQPRDWIHADDVVQALLSSTQCRNGVYDVCTYRPVSPKNLVMRYLGNEPKEKPQIPGYRLVYANQPLPGWKPKIFVPEWIDGQLRGRSAPDEARRIS